MIAMEDLVPILWVVVAAGAMIYNATTKARGKKRRAHHAEPAQSEAWPAMELPKEQPVSSKVPHHASEPLRRGLERPNPTSARPGFVKAVVDSSVDTGRGASFGKQPSVKTEMPEEAQQMSDATINDTFDLRRAVIYSELLKPKFDE